MRMTKLKQEYVEFSELAGLNLQEERLRIAGGR